MQCDMDGDSDAPAAGETAELIKVSRRSAWRRALPLLGGLLLVAAATLVITRHPGAQQAPPAAGSAPAVPVTVTKSTRQDVPVWLGGLGTVQALNTVLVRSRVDGTLDRSPSPKVSWSSRAPCSPSSTLGPTRPCSIRRRRRRPRTRPQLANAKLDLQRYDSLAKKDFASRQQVDTQVAMVNQNVAALKGDDATIETAQLNLSFCYITAPFDGRVGLRLVDPGNLVHATDPGGIVTLTEVHPITVVFTLPQADLPPILNAMTSRKLEVAAWSNRRHRQSSPRARC